MANKTVPNYAFNATAKTVTLSDFTAPRLERLKLIVNVTTGAMLYNFADPTLGATVTGNVFTLLKSGSLGADTDKLSITYDTLAGDPDMTDSAEPIETERLTLREDFDGGSLDTTNIWETPTLGTGQSFNVASSLLAITGGTTANSVATFRTKVGFRLPVRIQFTLAISARVANSVFEVAVVNAAGTTFAGWHFDGTTATQQKVTFAHLGVSSSASPSSAITTTNSTAAQAIYELDLRADLAAWNERVADSAVAPTNRAARTRTIPEPNEIYYIRLRVTNGATAPTAVTYNVDQILVQDNTKTVVEISSGRGSTALAQSIPVTVSNTPAVTMTSTTITGTVATSLTSTTLAAPAATVAGLTPLRVISAGSNNAAVVKGSAGRVTGWHFHNTNGAVRYVKLYNKATAPAPATDTSYMIIPVPANSAIQFGTDLPITFATGIGIAITSQVGDTDATTVGANDVVGTLFYV